MTATKESGSLQAAPNTSLRKFRERNPRIDYYPAAEARAAIAGLHRQYPGHSVSDVVNALVLAGRRAFVATRALSEDRPTSASAEANRA
jgi:hypothetical protein